LERVAKEAAADGHYDTRTQVQLVLNGAVSTQWKVATVLTVCDPIRERGRSSDLLSWRNKGRRSGVCHRRSGPKSRNFLPGRHFGILRVDGANA
jgi:hypothetical protein